MSGLYLDVDSRLETRPDHQEIIKALQIVRQIPYSNCDHALALKEAWEEVSNKGWIPEGIDYDLKPHRVYNSDGFCTLPNGDRHWKDYDCLIAYEARVEAAKSPEQKRVESEESAKIVADYNREKQRQANRGKLY